MSFIIGSGSICGAGFSQASTHTVADSSQASSSPSQPLGPVEYISRSTEAHHTILARDHLHTLLTLGKFIVCISCQAKMCLKKLKEYNEMKITKLLFLIYNS